MCLLSLFHAPPGLAEAATFRDALIGGKAVIKLRYRFENVDDDAVAKEANASTLRTSLGYRTDSYKGFSLYLEAENVTEIGLEDQFNNRGAGSLNNGVRDRPVIADPEGTEVEQAYLRFERGKTKITVGRQAVAIGDQRFVGPVAWRQNHQSFDALRIEASSLGPASLAYTYIDNTNRIFGDNRPMSSHLVNADFKLSFGKIATYAYLLDFTRDSESGASTSTFGVELSGKAPLGFGDLLFEAEYARQQDFADNPAEIEADYLHARLGVAFGDVTVEGAFERLEGDASNGRFQTPLATLHKFNGWTDKFLVTPPSGLDDLWLAIKGKHGAISWLAAYHDFSAESADVDYGTELNVQLTYKTSWAQVFGIKAAFYDADAFSTDTEKLWFWTAYTF